MSVRIEHVEIPVLVGADLGAADRPRDIPGSSIIGCGYNVFEGDYASALSTSRQLFDLTNKTEQQIDPLHTYSIPINVKHLDINKGEFRTITGKTIEEHQTKLLQQAGISGEYMGFKGSLDLNFEKSNFRRSFYQYSTCMDLIERWALRLEDATLLPDVEDEISSLAPTDLFDKYGTHYLCGIIVGARATSSSEINTLKYKSDYALEVIAEMSYRSTVGSATAKDRTKYGESVSSFQEASNTRIITIGGNPQYGDRIKDGDYRQWSESTDERPVFIDFTKKGLPPIWELCRDESRKSELQEAYTEYAGEKGGLLESSKGFPLQTGDLIALQPAITTAGKYLSVISYKGNEEIWASKMGIDQFSRFTVTVFDDGNIALQSAFTGKYLSVISYKGNEEIWASKTFVDQIAIDIFSRFSVTYLDGERIALKSAITGKYLSVIAYEGNDEIWASKPTKDDFCEFKVYIL